MLDRRAFAYRKFLLRSARLRVGKVRIAGLPAIMIGLATMLWAACAGGALLAFGIAAIVAASNPGRASGATPRLARTDRPGLPP